MRAAAAILSFTDNTRLNAGRSIKDRAARHSSNEAHAVGPGRGIIAALCGPAQRYARKPYPPTALRMRGDGVAAWLVAA